MEGWSLPEAAQRCETADVRPFLEQGLLAACASVGGRVASPVAIPHAAWGDLELADAAGSCLIHRPSKAELLDLKIHPLLHAPGAAELLHDRDLGEVFMTAIVRDPEVAALGRRVMALHGYRDVFLNGQAPGPIVDWRWYLDWNAASLADAFVHCIVSFWEEAPAPPSAALAAASAVLADRIAALRALLSGGSVAAKGTHRSSGHFGPVHRAQWLRGDQAIDVRRGDLCETDGSKWTANWTGIVLEHPGPLPAVPLEARFAQAIAGRADKRRSSSAAETQCRCWLERLIREHPDRKPRPKEALLAEALDTWPFLSRRAFERAWMNATAGRAGEVWRLGGRPRKTPAPENPAPE